MGFARGLDHHRAADAQGGRVVPRLAVGHGHVIGHYPQRGEDAAGSPPDLLLLPRGEGDLDDERAAAPFLGGIAPEQLPDRRARDGQGSAAGLRRDAREKF